MAEVIIRRGYKIVSGGTDNHLMLIDLMDKNITGLDAENQLGLANITTNKNAVPNDKQSPFITSGLRIGTPAITTRGFKEAECTQVAEWLCDVLDDLHNPATIARIKAEVIALCRKFPVYGAQQHQAPFRAMV
jgi:glycine hydroxymethyltransferase